MKIFNIKAISVCFAVAGVVAVAISSPTYAAEKTWIGDGADNNFSTAENWSDGTIPKNGDSLVFGSVESSTGRHYTGVNDISDLSISGISFTCSNKTGELATYFYADKPMTLTGNPTNDGCALAHMNGRFILGADVAIRDLTLGGLATSYPNQGLDLNGHKLTLSSPDGFINVNEEFTISGNGTVDYKSSGIIYGKNTYTGTTNINISESEASIMYSLKAYYLAGFGTSTININAGKIIFVLGGSLGEPSTNINNNTLANTINIKNNITNFYSLSFDCMNCKGDEVLKVPNINLRSNVGLDIKDMVINLAGIKANGYCVQYWDSGTIVTTGIPSSFLNAPAACRVDDDSTSPGVPNTSGNITNNPIAILSIGAGIALVAFALTREKKTA